jgi:putative two-component system response regulator
VPSGEKLFKLLEKTTPDLILLDIEMPEMNGHEVIKRLKESKCTRDIPVIFLTARNDNGSELEGLSMGAIDYIGKPFSPALLLKRIDLHLLVESQKKVLEEYNVNLQKLVDKKTEAVLQLQNAVLQTIAELVECRDDITGGHIERTQHYLRILVYSMLDMGVYTGRAKEWANSDLFFQSAQLHDVGKIAISDSILMKPGRLTDEEFRTMQSHTTFGGKVIEKIISMTSEQSFLEHAKIFAETHHEKWDGSGYPNGLKGEDIPLQGRLMAIADVYDALISERPYKKAMPHHEAAAIIKEGRGTHFDPLLVDVFVSVADSFYKVTLFSKKHADSPPRGPEAMAELDDILHQALSIDGNPI